MMWFSPRYTAQKKPLWNNGSQLTGASPIGDDLGIARVQRRQFFL
jgi:hypothetical protein